MVDHAPAFLASHPSPSDGPHSISTTISYASEIFHHALKSNTGRFSSLLSHINSPGRIALVSIVLSWLIYRTLFFIRQDIQIRRLGKRPTRITTWSPFGLYDLWQRMQAIKRVEVYEFLDSRVSAFQRADSRKEMTSSKTFNDRSTIEVYLAGQRILFTTNYENIQAILAKQFYDFGKGDSFNRKWKDFLGNSIFTTDGTRWADARQLLRPLFTKDRLIQDIPVFEKHTQNLFDRMIKDQKSGMMRDGPVDVDIADIFYRFTLDAATDILLGRSVDSLKIDDNPFANAFADVQMVQSRISRMGNLSWMLSRKKFFAGIRAIESFVEPYINEAVNMSPEELQLLSKKDHGYTFLYALAGYTQDKTVLRDQVIGILLAGRDTTACTLSWLFHELSVHPEVVEKLRNEISDSVGMNEPTYDDLKNMKYLQHTINETLRLYPVIPFNIRIALKDTTLPSGGGPDGSEPIGILKGTPIGYSPLAMQRRLDLYPDTDEKFPPIREFSPDRWDSWTPPAWTYIPFNGGPRICIGQQFALTEMSYVITRILQRYDRIEDRMGGVKPKLHTDIVLAPYGGVHIRLHPSLGFKG